MPNQAYIEAFTDPLAGAIKWVKSAIPEPTPKDFNVQLGVHLEEFAETLSEITVDSPDLALLMTSLIESIKAASQHAKTYGGFSVRPENRIAFLDGLCDTLQTSASVAHTANMDLFNAMVEVVASNFSKFVEGNPIFDENKKVIKGPNYFKPNIAIWAKE